MSGISMNLSIGLSISGRGISRGKSLLPLQIVGTRGEISNLNSPNGRRQSGRHRAYIGGKALNSIAFADGNYYVSATAEVNGAVAFDLQRAVEYNGVSIPITWSGANLISVEPGATVISDEIPASAFGVSEIPADAQIWMRWERTRPLSNTMVVHASSAYPTAISGETTVQRDTDDASQVYNTGALTTGSGWTNTFGATQYFPLAVLGRPVSKLMSLMVVGASKEYGQSDSTGDGNNDGGGYVRRACQSVGGSRMPYVNTARIGESSQVFIANSSKRMILLPYCTHVLCGHGGNDYSTSQTIGNTITRITTEWEMLKTYDAPVHMVLEMPKTDSTDSWATVENQTPRTGYETGGAWRDVFNTHITDSNGTLIDGVVDLNGDVADAVSIDKFKLSSTSDGTHPNKASHITLATTLAGYLADLKTAYEV